jgi:hypothetical protein
VKVHIDGKRATFERELSDSLRALLPAAFISGIIAFFLLKDQIALSLAVAYSSMIIMLVMTEIFPEEIWTLQKEEGIIIHDHSLFGKTERREIPSHVVLKKYVFGDTLLLSYEKDVFDLTSRSVFFFRELEVKRLAEWLNVELKKEIL